MFFPLYGLILTSIQPENIIRSRNLSFFPTEIIFTHFAEVLKPNHISNIYEGIKNSLIVSFLTSFLCIILAFPAAYSLARLNLPAKNIILGRLETSEDFKQKTIITEKPKEVEIEGLKITVRLVDKKDLEERKLSKDVRGVVITKIAQDSPVNYLETGNIIVEAQKKKINTIGDLENIVKITKRSSEKTLLIAIYNNQNQRRYIGVKLD